MTFFDWENPAYAGYRERLSILNAYYLPGRENAYYKAITPVNTFRVIFNQYFGTKLSILPDRSFFSIYSDWFNFTDATEILDQLDRAGNE